MDQLTPFEDVQARIDALLDRTAPPADIVGEAERALDEGEAMLEAWLRARGKEPTMETVEGFRVLALHRQAAKGDPSFNACRETCRELVYLRNVVTNCSHDTEEAFRQLRLQAMVLRHLSLFLGGKLQEAGLGEFCCSARPLRSRDSSEEALSAPVGAAD